MRKENHIRMVSIIKLNSALSETDLIDLNIF
jgi:hypothetical protein